VFREVTGEAIVKITTFIKGFFIVLPMTMLAGVSVGQTVLAANTPTAASTPNGAPAANRGTPTDGAPAAAAAQNNSGDVIHPLPAQRNPRYKICRDDVLTLTFPIAPEFNQSISVMPDGYVNLQGVGSIYVMGLTVPETVEALKKAYTGVLHDPIIDVDLADFQRPYFVALGQVLKPGQYDLRYDMTVTQAVAVAGGFAPTAKTQLLLYHAISPTMMEVKKLNIKDILNGKNVNEEVHLSPGDMIFVPEKAITKFRKYVPYAIGIGTGVTVPY
jgi:polysaccharide biosynthesis/export protein